MKKIFEQGVNLLIKLLRWVNGQGPLRPRNPRGEQEKYSLKPENILEGILRLQANSKPNPHIRQFLAPKKYKAKDLLAEIQRQRNELKAES